MLKTFWEEFSDVKDPLMNVRQKHWDLFEHIGLPTAKQEAFQYLSKQFSFPAPAKRSEEIVSFSKLDTLIPLEEALRSYGLFLQTRLTKLLSDEKDPFALLNGVFQTNGRFLYVPPKCKAALHIEQKGKRETMSSQRLHIFLGRNASLKLTQSGQGGYSNTFFDISLDEGARLEFYDEAIGSFQSIRSTLKRDSYFKMVSLGKTVRTSIKVQLAEENAESALFGLSRLHGSEESHVHVHMEHIAPNTRSRQHFKTVLKDKSRFSFEGKIHVHPTAQKTEGYQLCNALILSDEALSNAKPNLEIFADDVKASHGATVGQLDAEALFYLRSRGLRAEEAKEVLVKGFCQEILDHARSISDL